MTTTTKWPKHMDADEWAELTERHQTYDRNRLIMGDPVPQDNHEAWKVCASCGAWFDARWGWICPDCNHDNTP